MRRLSKLPVGATNTGWRLLLLRDLAVSGGIQTGPFGSQLKASEYQTAGVPVVMPQNISGGSIDEACVARTSATKAQSLARHRLRAGDVVFSRRGDLAKIAVADSRHTDWICGTGCLRARLDPDRVDSAYLRYYLMQPFPLHWLQSQALGQTLLNLNTTIVGQLPILLPEIQEQRRIAATLATWDEAIEKTERLIHFADARLRGLTRRLVDARCNTWPHEHLDHVFRAVSRKAPNGTQPLSVTQDRGVVPRTEMERRIAASDQSVAAYKHMRPGDFAVSLRSFEGGLEHSEYEGGVSAAYTVLRPALSIDARFYKYFFKSDTFVGRYLAKSVVGIRDGKQIDMAGLLITAIPLPPIDEQRRIADVLDEARHEIDLLTRLKQRYELQRRGLEQRLLTLPDTQRAAS